MAMTIKSIPGRTIFSLRVAELASFSFFSFFFGLLMVVVETEMLHVPDGIPDGSTTAIQTGRDYGFGDHGLAPGLSRSSWIVRGRSSSRASHRVETVRYTPTYYQPTFFFLARLCIFSLSFYFVASTIREHSKYFI